MVGENNSVARALALYRGLIRPAAALRQPFPGNMLTVIALATSDEAMLLEQQLTTGETAETLMAAASCFLELLVTRAGNSDLGLLGLDPGASPEQVRAHKRALLKWLHPDRNKNAWQAALYAKVSTAARRVERNEAELVSVNNQSSLALRQLAVRHRFSGNQRRPRSGVFRVLARGSGLRRLAVLAVFLVAMLFLLQLRPDGPELLQARLPGF